MGLGDGDLGRLCGGKGSASQLVGDSLPCSYALYSVIGCMHTLTCQCCVHTLTCPGLHAHAYIASVACTHSHIKCCMLTVTITFTLSMQVQLTDEGITVKSGLPRKQMPAVHVSQPHCLCKGIVLQCKVMDDDTMCWWKGST